MLGLSSGSELGVVQPSGQTRWGPVVVVMGTRYLAFQYVAQRVLALDGHPSGGAGSDSDDWLKDSRSPSQISGRRLSAGLLGRGRLRSDYRRSQRVFRFLLQFDRTRRCLRAELLGSARGHLRRFEHRSRLAGPRRSGRRSQPARLSAPTRSPPRSPRALAHPISARPVALPPTGLLTERVRGRASAGSRWKDRRRPPRCPRAALLGNGLSAAFDKTPPR